jgi:hypothetical protein
MAEYTIPGGRNKGTPITEAPDGDLNYWIDRISGDLTANPQKKFAERDRAWVDAANSELERRGIEGGSPPGAQSAPQAAPAPRQQKPRQQALAKAEPVKTGIVGAFADAGKATDALQEASRKCHLITPATICGSLPEGCEVYTSVVAIDPYGPELYQITGSRKHPSDSDVVGLDRVALAKLGAAAGVTWITSRRTDDGTDPHYCAWQAIARVRLFDGQVADRPGNVELDARDGSPLIEEIITKARNATDERGNPKPRDPQPQIMELRKFLLRHAESKAMNRAIAALGIRRSYKRADIQAKPFVVARLAFTGRSEDPEARREFRQMIGQSFMASSAALYGGPAATGAALPSAPPPLALQAPPPVGSVPVDDDAYNTSGESADDARY